MAEVDSPIRPWDNADRDNTAEVDDRTWDVDRVDTWEDRACKDSRTGDRRVNRAAGDFHNHEEEEGGNRVALLQDTCEEDIHKVEELRDVVAPAEGLEEAVILVDLHPEEGLPPRQYFLFHQVILLLHLQVLFRQHQMVLLLPDAAEEELLLLLLLLRRRLALPEEEHRGDVVVEVEEAVLPLPVLLLVVEVVRLRLGAVSPLPSLACQLPF